MEIPKPEASKSSSSSSDSSRKRPLDVGAGISTGAGPHKKNASSSSDGGKETPSEKSSDGDISDSDSPKIPIYQNRYTKDFVQKKLLGKGGYGKVYECKNILDKTTYAVKKIPFKDDSRERCLREARILAAIQHPGIIRYYQCWIEDGAPDAGSGSSEDQEADATKTLFVVMELGGSTLHDLLEETKLLQEDDKWRILQETLEAVKCIHESGVIHGDISRDNIFLTDKKRVKIGDFGLARKFGDDMSGPLGNPMYQAPELLLDPRSISAKSDMFALGLVVFEIFHPMKTESERIRELERLKETFKVTGELGGTVIGSVIDGLLSEDPELRPSATDVLSLNFGVL